MESVISALATDAQAALFSHAATGVDNLVRLHAVDNRINTGTISETSGASFRRFSSPEIRNKAMIVTKKSPRGYAIQSPTSPDRQGNRKTSGTQKKT